MTVVVAFVVVVAVEFGGVGGVAVWQRRRQ